MNMKTLWVLFLLLAAQAIELDYDSYYTAPASLQEKGYLYITFCSTKDTTREFEFYPQDFSVSPLVLDINFDGTTAVPDCRQVVVQATSDSPGLFDLVIDAGGDDWVLPVEFSKIEPILISISDSVLYTGYDQVNLVVSGIGDNVWLTIDSSIVGVNTFHKSSLPATFSVNFYFSKEGFYSVPVTLSYDKNDYTLTQTYDLGIRVEKAPVRVNNNLRVPSDGYSNMTIDLELPEKIYSGTLTLISDCLSGETSKRVENFQSGELSLLVKGECDPGIYEVDLTIGDFETSVPLDVYGPEGYEFFFNTFEKSGVHSLEVVLANEGSQTMKAVSMRLLDGDYQKVREGSFIGDLDFGDFDSSELKFIPLSKSVDLNVKISYTQSGERKEILKTYPYTYVKSSNSTWIIIVIVLIGGGFWYAKRRKSRR